MDQVRQKTVLAVTSLAGFIGTFMGSSINIALPQIGDEFRASAVMLGWISLSFTLATGAVLMPVGRLADLYGRKRILLIGLLFFTLTTFVSILAASAAFLLVFRVLQGLAAALIFATTTAIVSLAYPPETRGRALGTQVAAVYLGLTLGPILGGVICHQLGWRGLFAVVGVLSLANWLALVLGLRRVEWREPKRAHFDVAGSVIWALAFCSLMLGFSYLPGWIGAALTAAGVGGVALFLAWENRAADPVLNVDLLRHNSVFLFSNLAALINYAATSAMTFLMSLYLQYNRGLDAQTAGFILVCGTALQTLFSPVAGRLAERVNARTLASVGMGVCALGLFAFVFLKEDTPYWYVIAVLCALGVGFAFFASPITYTIMGSVSKPQVGLAGATLATMRVIGQTMSMGLATLVLAVVVGGQAIHPVDYPHLLTSVRATFAIFAALCVLGVAASLAGDKQTRQTQQTE